MHRRKTTDRTRVRLGLPSMHFFTVGFSMSNLDKMYLQSILKYNVPR
jgi:hypothetical protein